MDSVKGLEHASDNTVVNSAGTLTENHLSAPRPKSHSSSGGLLLFLGTAAVGLTLAASISIYLEGTRGLNSFSNAQFQQTSKAHGETSGLPPVPVSLKEMESWGRQLSAATVIGATGLVIAIMVGFVWMRRQRASLTNKYEEQAIAIGADLEKARAAANRYKAERERSERELAGLKAEIDKQIQQRTAQLSTGYAQLERELNDRRQAERVMTQQAKELERSKDVLELHVQVRTQELQKLQHRYESILNSAGEGIYGLDLQGRTTFVNPATAKITGWKVEDLVGKSEADIFHRRTGTESIWKKDLRGDGGDCILFYRKDGSSFPAEYIRTPIREKEKEIGSVIVFKDITERKRAEEAINRKAAELARSNSELEQFAYVASHDLQEPLRKIQAFGDRLKTKCDAANMSDGRDYLERMQSAAARMQTLINDLLTFSRVISASQPFVPVDLGGVIKGVLGDLEVRIEQTKARVEVGELPTIEADPLQMRQLLQNLIGNALKFQSPGVQPWIRINGRILANPFAGTDEDNSNDEQCELTIQDNGIGFDEKYIDKIFAVFQRLHGRTEFEGTGVGLAVCRRITDRHEGTIGARSKPGDGATFIITLPVRHPKKELAP